MSTTSSIQALLFGRLSRKAPAADPVVEASEPAAKAAPAPAPAAPPATVVAPAAAEPAAPAGLQGLRADYFHVASSVSRLSQIDFDAAPVFSGSVGSLNYRNVKGSFWEGGRKDHFAAKYTGELNVETGGRYTIFLTSDDGSALYIDGRRVIDNDGLHGALERKVTLDLSAGAHEIEIRYFEKTGGQTLRLEWSGPDSKGKRQLIDGEKLGQGAQEPDPDPGTDPGDDHGGHDHGGDTGGDTGGNGGNTGGGHDHGGGSVMAGLRAAYFALPAAVSSLEQIDFAAPPTATAMVDGLDTLRSTTPFWQGGSADHFAAQYTGDLKVATGGRYTFYLTSDDGSALYVGGQRIINNDGLHGTMELKVTLDLPAGSHPIEIRYFERDGEQSLKLEWSGPDSNGQRVLLDGKSISHVHGSTPADPADPGDGGGHDHGGDGDTGGDDDTGGDGGGGHDHGGDGGGNTGGGGHDHGGNPIPLPQTPQEIAAYVAAVKAEPDAHAHPSNPGMALEHMQLLDLVPRAEATHVAVANGDWFDPSTWHEGRIPGADAKVLIPRGVSVTYDGESDASLFTLRVDGLLSFATDTDTKMVIDTLVVSPSGKLEIGTEENPVEAGVDAQIIIADNGDIDVNWDPGLLSRGILSHGAVEIHGAEKTAFLAVAEAPMAGDRVIELSEIPTGWQVGDKLVLTGTHKQGWTWDNAARRVVYRESEDEEVTITGIDGTRITLDRPLNFDHDAPREDLAAYVANMTRNITVTSESGEDSAVHHRGHVMFMHSDDVDVRYAAFTDLGRTDKSEPAFDIGTVSSVQADSNVKGRYSLHFHKTGTLDQENPAIALGNVVDGSPGWGFVHHSSHADFIDNVAFDVFGAAYAAEDGDETGSWLHNIAIRSQGIGYGDSTAKEMSDVARHDNGRTGDGFFFAGRLVEAADNVAANTTHGYVWMHRSAPTNPLADNLTHPETAHGADTMPVQAAVIQGFHDNEAFGTQVGLIVVKSQHWQDHDVRSVLDGFLNWETAYGVDISYTSHYTILDVDLIATRNTAAVAGPETAVRVSGNAFDIVFNGLTIEGFRTGVDFAENQHSFSSGNADYGHVLIDVLMSGVGTAYAGLSTARHTVMSSDNLAEGRLSFVMRGDTTLSMGETFYFDGVKTDSIGARDRQFAGDRQKIEADGIVRLLQEDGYYVTASGQKVMLIEDLIADRATGQLVKFSHVVTLQMTDSQLGGIGAVNNGLISFGGRPAVAADDSASVQAGMEALIDVLANDRDPDGGALRVDGLTDPRHGNVFLQEDGSVLYRPNEGFTGTDSFSYWAADDEGFYTQATVTVDVWDTLM